MESVADQPLSWFFDQWLTRPGMPVVRGSWRFDPDAKQLHITVKQLQGGTPFRLPLEVGIVDATGAVRIERMDLSSDTGTFAFSVETRPASVALDPNTWLLMQIEEFTAEGR